MKQNVIDVLMYLFENYMMDGPESLPDQDTLAEELAGNGFHSVEIDGAFAWLDELSNLCGEQAGPSSDREVPAIRQYTGREAMAIDTEAQGLLLSLERAGIFDATTREIVIDRVIALNQNETDIEDIKWVVMMVLYNHPDKQDLYSEAEDLIFQDVPPYLH